MRTTLKKIIYFILQLEARLVVWKYKPKIIAITGSVGKTSTKDAIYAVLKGVTYVRKSEKSYNSQIGLPLTILGVPNGWNNLHLWLRNLAKGLWLVVYPHKYPEWLVLEVGVGKPDDMRTTASWLRTDVVVMTAIGETPVHVEFFESRKHLVEEKEKLIKTLKRDGFLVLNADDETILEMKHKTKNRVVTYGFKEGSDILASGENIAYDDVGIPRGIIFRIDEGGKSLPVEIDGVFGKNHIYAVLASLAIASALKFNLLDAISALRNYDAPPGRMRILPGENGTLIIDDSYNSSPHASTSALQTLGELKPKGRRIAVLGDMLELGRHTKEEHEKIGGIAKENVEILLVVGQRAKSIKDGALASGMKEKAIFEFGNARETGEFLKTFIKEGDIILVKGSQGMRMERAVAMILKDKENKERLLVRQEKEWLAKE
ncbi:hypothetical protein A2733_00505 [Candidatus Nomurabacteria bacterium RIFCSPHIGHO2_01_FULL_40_20]|uniref:UDP-N-acetylmuramoyl-tripeptide--D-alanyl-D-alanine ligase n=2 Tax=Candidatus Nomuraibacteriota TaxID=1752729 RepID=A0A1F6V255_9BACT|nr:MAG: hypothetical protein A2733_00505 [Candidatus Nomurabacteria bacterium RIFCSPHIGHO2_01_FULL_40_20]